MAPSTANCGEPQRLPRIDRVGAGPGLGPGAAGGRRTKSAAGMSSAEVMRSPMTASAVRQSVRVTSQPAKRRHRQRLPMPIPPRRDQS